MSMAKELSDLENQHNKELAKRVRRKDTRGQEILEAAVSVFSEQGYKSVNFYEVAKRGHMARTTVYLYFKSREELLVAMIRKIIGDRIEKVKESHVFEVAKSDFDTGLKNLIRMLAVFFKEPVVVKLLHFIAAESDSLPAVRKVWEEEFSQMFLKAWQDMLSGAGLSASEERVMRTMIFGPFIEISLLGDLLGGNAPELDEMAEIMPELFKRFDK